MKNDAIKTCLAQPLQIIDRLRQAVHYGELPDTANADSLGDSFATFG
ncbi:hypothetical protein [Serratia rubidaea]|uniref:Uncharacterized protein n=1 Tax=Serratia rubidaea TaxID=61652 RepID=A0ABS0M7T8_SERRU|nr:hypothetical protein [Serratia rubidaea]MBH1928317.1 hypothetical protein [Serratia rubidaea]